MAEKKSVPEGLRSSEQRQSSFCSASTHPSSSVSLPRPVPGSAAVVPAFPTPLRAVAERTNAVCDLSPSENNPRSALSPYIAGHKEGKSRQKTNSHPKGWVKQQLLSNSVCDSVRSSIGTGRMRRKKAKICFLLTEQDFLFRSLLCAHIRA